MSIKSILLNALKPGFFPVMFDKVVKRLKEPSLKVSKRESLKWCQSQETNTIDFIENINYELADEAKTYNAYLNEHGRKIINSLPVKMGGAGNSILIYFLTRYFKPEVIVETGVSMGFSSHAFLTAINKNKSGKLYSSDFPYFRIEDPEKYIGCVVEDKLKEGWELFVKGDEVNLQEIHSKVDKIDFIHYDSDKSYGGREKAYLILRDKLHPKSVIVYDDIADNLHFKDFVDQNKLPFRVLKGANGGYVGICANFLEE